jgi:prepilin-type processing-associated H-X9-DG protein
MCGRTSRGVTIVELLAVVAVIALLAAVLVPSFARAKDTARDAQCRSNLHQIYSIMHTGGAMMPPATSWVAIVRGRGGSGAMDCPNDGPKRAPVSTEAELTGDVQWIEPPPNCRFNVVESNQYVRAFVEQECYRLPADVTVNISQPGMYASDASLTPTVLPAGTVVDSLFLFFDPVGSQNATASGKVKLPGEIIGVICKTAQLDASDATLGRPGTIYATGQDGARGFELGAEKVELSSDRRTFVLHNFQSTYPGENVRILTVPGGLASYGMNNQVQKAPRAGQIMMADYNRTIIDFDGKLTDDNPGESLAPRHNGRVNVMYCDGAITSMSPDDLQADSPEWKPQQ